MTDPQGRRAQTRARLLGAAVAVLVDHGLDGFTTTAVAARAGASQGSVFQHFPTKRDLLVATVEDALRTCREDQVAAFGARLSARPGAGAHDVIRLALEALWASFTDDRMLAVAEVRARCRTDEDLRHRLDAVIGTENEISGGLVPTLVPDAFHLGGDAYLDLSRIVLNAMQGRALASMARPDPERDRAIVEALITLVCDHYDRAAPASIAALRGRTAP